HLAQGGTGLVRRSFRSRHRALLGRCAADDAGRPAASRTNPPCGPLCQRRPRLHRLGHELRIGPARIGPARRRIAGHRPGRADPGPAGGIAGMLRGLFAVDTLRRIESAWLAQVPRGELMRRAGTAVAEQATRMLRRMPPETTVLLLVGPGNNGGDALVAGRILGERGYAVRACAIDTILRAPPRAQDAADAWAAWHAAGGSLLALEDRSSPTQR